MSIITNRPTTAHHRSLLKSKANTAAKPVTRRAPAPQPARPFGIGVLSYASTLLTPTRRLVEDCGALSPSERNPKPSDLVSDRDKADWVSMCAEREAREQARETVAEWREESSRREIMNEIDLACSRYEVSANLSGFISEW